MSPMLLGHCAGGGHLIPACLHLCCVGTPAWAGLLLPSGVPGTVDICGCSAAGCIVWLPFGAPVRGEFPWSPGCFNTCFGRPQALGSTCSVSVATSGSPAGSVPPPETCRGFSAPTPAGCGPNCWQRLLGTHQRQQQHRQRKQEGLIAVMTYLSLITVLNMQITPVSGWGRHPAICPGCSHRHSSPGPLLWASAGNCPLPFMTGQ